MRVGLITFLIWLVATVTAIFVAWLAFPSNVPPPVFYGRLLMVAWLVTANKVPSLLMVWLAQDSRSRYAAVIGALHIVTFFYSAIAAVVLIAHVVELPLVAQSAWHLSVQAVLLGLMVLTCLCIALVVEGGVERR